MEIKLEDTVERKPVTITFTPEEFEMLKAISGQVSGSGPMRAMMDSIYGFGETNGYDFVASQSSVRYVAGWKMYCPE